MIFRPLSAQTNPREIAFIVDANADLLEVCTEDGWSDRRAGKTAESLIARLRKMAVYSLVKPKQLILFSGAQNWQVVKYHGRVQRLIYKESVSIYPWSTFGPDPQALLPLFDALRDIQVHPSSLSTMARNSWLRTLRRPVWIKEWGGNHAGRKSFVGGRKEAVVAPANYVGAHYLDLPAAYLGAMESPFPLHLREVEPRWAAEGLAEAIVNIPSQGWNPLPIRLGKARRGTDFQVYGYGRTRGFWPISELHNAMENHGVGVELLRVWKGAKFEPIFADWLSWAMELRTLPGISGLVAKMLTTRLWSLFAINNDQHTREIVTFTDARGREKFYTPFPVKRSRAGDAGTTFLASLVSSRVRVRLLEELIPKGAVYVDTDGGIAPSNVGVQGWRQTRVMDRVEIKGSQAFRWHCPSCSESHLPWHYSIAGVPSDSPFCPALFEYARPNILYDLGPGSLTIPSQEVNDARRFAESQKLEISPLETESL